MICLMIVNTAVFVDKAHLAGEKGVGEVSRARVESLRAAPRRLPARHRGVELRNVVALLQARKSQRAQLRALRKATYLVSLGRGRNW